MRWSSDAGRIRIEALETPRGLYGPLTLALRGRHQLRNATVAVRLLEELAPEGIRIPRNAMEQALADVRWRGRLELIDCAPGRHLLLDPAHNVAAAAALGAYVTETYPSGLPFVFGTLGDKDGAGMLAALGSAARRIICTPIASPRARPVADLLAAARASGCAAPIESAASPAEAGLLRLADWPRRGSRRLRVPRGRGPARARPREARTSARPGARVESIAG